MGVTGTPTRGLYRQHARARFFCRKTLLGKKVGLKKIGFKKANPVGLFKRCLNAPQSAGDLFSLKPKNNKKPKWWKKYEKASGQATRSATFTWNCCCTPPKSGPPKLKP
jgi:hypothetical protein